ncbi:MAG TPA: isocitrate/isopropylmalate family dehydrogenase [Ktedonobacterales bacterium]|nr:isocitrate/isopropylmalate family dehydrogenase [Ktedonobacterales bacterium]
MAQLVLRPRDFDVIVGSNLFGDILSEITAAVSGSIGIAPSANLDPERCHPSRFEPIHGSAPEIAGRGIASPRRSAKVGSHGAEVTVRPVVGAGAGVVLDGACGARSVQLRFT